MKDLVADVRVTAKQIRGDLSGFLCFLDETVKKYFSNGDFNAKLDL